MKISLPSRRIPLVGAAVLAAGAVAAGPAMAKTLYVNPRGHDVKACAKTAPCRTIGYAVSKSKKGDVVDVAKGTYRASVTIGRDIRLIGFGKPVINAKGFNNGVLITGAKSQGSHVTGFVVENANDEGILAMQTSHVLIAGNAVRHNDLGMFAKAPKGECAAQGPVPGDCGEGIHLMSVFASVVRNNTSTHNSGGILLSDEFGPTHDNLISGNRVLSNLYDCGITVVGHNPHAVSATGALQPTAGGVYRNDVIDNTINGNGLKGFGGGIILAGGPPGTAVYGNTIQHNQVSNNGLGGLTLHSHAPGQDLNNNRILDNTFIHNGLAGGPHQQGDVDAGVTKTVGIVVWSAVTKLTGILISGNHLGNEYYGIWTQNAPKVARSANTFGKGVTVPVYQK